MSSLIRWAYTRAPEAIFVCPSCSAETTDPALIQAGLCSGCEEFTGLCQAGRKLRYPHRGEAREWHRACPARGAILWNVLLPAAQAEISRAGDRAGEDGKVLLCARHSAEAAHAPWIQGVSLLRIRKETPS